MFRRYAVLIALTVVVTTAAPYAQNRTAAPRVTPPKDQFGHAIGDDYYLVNYTQYVDYLKKLDVQSERMIVTEIGKTEEGRPEMTAIITSPENQRRLPLIKEANRKLALADGLTDDQARQLARDGKIVVWIDGGLHATEVLGAQQLIETMYRLASKTDPETLRVLNDDVIAPGRGFGAHPHRDMEIVTWVIQGALAHRDSSGGEGVLRPGEVQTMTAGTGIVHSEYNASATEPVHFLQMWVEPARAGLTPRYGQKAFPEAARRGVLLPVVSNGSIEGTLPIHQDATMFVGTFQTGQSLTHRNTVGEHSHLYVAGGQVRIGEEILHAGDAAHITGREELAIQVEAPTELVLSDLECCELPATHPPPSC